MATTNFSDKEVVRKYSELVPLAQVVFNRPALIEFIGNVSGKKILDVGCGNGWLSAKLCEQGASCIGVDKSPEFIEKAKSKFPQVDFKVLNGADMSEFSDSSFDCVVMSMVLIAIGSQSEFQKVFLECRRVLKDNGTLVFSIIHPVCVCNNKDAAREIILPDGGGYLQTGMFYVAKILLSDRSSWITFSNCQWTLGDIMRELKKNGFAIVDLMEPAPTSQMPDWELLKGAAKIPDLLFFKCTLRK